MNYVNVANTDASADCTHRAECLSLIVQDALVSVASPRGGEGRHEQPVQTLADLVLGTHAASFKKADILNRRRHCTRNCPLRDLGTGPT